MKIALLQVFRALLVLGLTMYGPMAMAGQRTNGAVFSTEICANGVLETLYVDASGAPVEPHGKCLDCQVCCHISVSSTDVPCGTLPIPVLIDAPEASCSSRIFYLRKQMTRPMPRGPPVAHHLDLTAPELIGIDQEQTGNKKCGRGRSFSKDATA